MYVCIYVYVYVCTVVKKVSICSLMCTFHRVKRLCVISLLSEIIAMFHCLLHDNILNKDFPPHFSSFVVICTEYIFIA